MNKLFLSELMIANSFWKAIQNSHFSRQAESDARLIAEATYPLVEEFPTEAGSISVESAKLLWLITRYFSPKIIIEVGTYIGRSSLAMGFGGYSSLQKLHTCDGTFDNLDFNRFKEICGSINKHNLISKISYYGKTFSTDMLTKIKERGEKADLIFIDGRISPEDCNLLQQVTSETCVYILDDFQGVEKGVANAMLLRKFFRNYILLEPRVENNEREILAILVPASIISLSRQQTLPVSM